MNSKAKGASGERELAKLLRSYGYEARRGVQYSGLQGDADVVGVNGIHIECKRCERVNDEAFLQQAERDARKGNVPVVMYRRNNEKWKACLRLDLFMAIWSELDDAQRAKVYEKSKFFRK